MLASLTLSSRIALFCVLSLPLCVFCSLAFHYFLWTPALSSPCTVLIECISWHGMLSITQRPGGNDDV